MNSATKIKNMISAVINEDGDKMSLGSLRTLKKVEEMVREMQFALNDMERELNQVR